MKRILCAAVMALAVAGCPENGSGGPPPAEPIAIKGPPRGPPPGPPAPKPPPEPVAEAPKEPPKPAEPKGPAGLTRSKVGDQIEFAWTRIGAEELNPLDQAKAMGMMQGGGVDMEKIKQLTQGAQAIKPQQSKKTGTVVVARVEPESPFTFRVEIKAGKDSETRHYAYSPDIPLHEVVFHTDPADPRKKMKVAGVEREVVEKESRILAPEVDGLALSGGLVSETSPEQSQGAVSVTLTKFGTTKSVAAPGEKPRTLDTFEAPLTVAMKAISKFGILDPEEKLARDAKLMGEIQGAAQPCMKDAKPASGTLQGTIIAGKIESLMWAGGLPPKAFDKCLKEKIKKLKLPQDETFLNVQLPGDR